MSQLSVAARLDRVVPHFVRQAGLHACTGAGKISTGKGMRRLYKSILLVSADASRCRRTLGFAACQTIMGRVHRASTAENNC